MANKKTKKDYFNILTTMVEATDREDKEELINFISHEIDLLTKKTTNKSLTKTQKENEDIKDAIVEALVNIGEAVTVTELLAKSPTVSDMVKGSNQKASALLKQLSDPEYNDLRVAKIIDKKRSLFRAN